MSEESAKGDRHSTHSQIKLKKGHLSWVWLDSTIFKRTFKYGIMKIKSKDNILIERGVTSNRAVVHRTK